MQLILAAAGGMLARRLQLDDRPDTGIADHLHAVGRYLDKPSLVISVSNTWQSAVGGCCDMQGFDMHSQCSSWQFI